MTASDLEIHICHHVWLPTNGRVEYRRGPMNPEPTMHVTCCKCNVRTWMTKEQWESMPEAEDDS